MNSKYEIIIYWSEEDDAYLAEVPELPGCMGDGRTCTEKPHGMDPGGVYDLLGRIRAEVPEDLFPGILFKPPRIPVTVVDNVVKLPDGIHAFSPCRME